MKRWLGLLLAIVAVLGTMLPAQVAEAASAAPTGCKVALQADNGKWFARCRDCQETVVELPDTVVVYVDLPNSKHPEAQFEVVDLGNGKIALKSDVGKYVARCNDCIKDGKYPDYLTIHSTDTSQGYTQFTPKLLTNGKYALRANTGKYVARCTECPRINNGSAVTVHVDDPTNVPEAQWNMIYVK